MADNTKIEWTDATWNPITGCSVVSSGCTNCYAMKLAGTRLKNHPSRKGLTMDTKAGPVWTGEVRFNEQWLLQPLKWTRPRMIFVCAHGDLFAEGVPEAWIDQVFAVMGLAPQHIFQVLTKRPERMRDYLTEPGLIDRLLDAAMKIDSPDGADWAADIACGHTKGLPLPNVWLGVSVENQKTANERIYDLIKTPAAIRWISAEPLLGPINIREAIWFGDKYSLDDIGAKLDWVVVGGESGPGARPMQPEWARQLRDECAATRTPFLFKQWGNHRPCSDANGPYMLPCTKAEAGRLLDGIEHNEFPKITAEDNAHG